MLLVLREARILLSPLQSVLFVDPEDDANGALWTEAQRPQMIECVPRHKAPTTIVHGSCAEVPTINVAAHHDDLVRSFRPLPFDDDVA
jgi:hypothetical protein